MISKEKKKIIKLYWFCGNEWKYLWLVGSIIYAGWIKEWERIKFQLKLDMSRNSQQLYDQFQPRNLDI